MKSHLWVKSLKNKKTVCHALSDASLETSFSQLVNQIEPEGSTASGVVTPMGTCFAVLQTASENDCREICRLSQSAGLKGVRPLQCFLPFPGHQGFVHDESAECRIVQRARVSRSAFRGSMKDESSTITTATVT